MARQQNPLISARVTPEQKAEVSRLAKIEGVDDSEYLRRAALRELENSLVPADRLGAVCDIPASLWQLALDACEMSDEDESRFGWSDDEGGQEIDWIGKADSVLVFIRRNPDVVDLHRAKALELWRSIPKHAQEKMRETCDAAFALWAD